MAKYLTVVWPVVGHLHPNLAVASELHRRGHEVAFYTGGKVRTLVEGEGFPVFPFERLDEARVDQLIEAIGARSASFREFATTGRLWREWLVDTIPDQLADLDRVLDAWKPDAIICDPAIWGPILVLRDARRIPVAVLSYLAGCLIPGPDAPMLGWSMPRPKSRPAKLGAALFRSLVRLGAREIPRTANRLRARYGLPPLDVGVAQYAGRMPLYLQQSLWEFDYRRTDLPPSVHYVGLCPWDRASNEPPPAFLAELPRDRPWVYVTDGTMHFQKPLVMRAALEGLGDLPLQIVATSKKKLDPAEFGVRRIPENARIEPWIPHSDLFPLVDLIVTTGGTQTVLKAIQAGIPLIVVPSAWDQGENAWRVVEAGVGLRLAPSECTPDRLRQAVQRILSDPSFRQNAKQLGEAFAKYRGPIQAADLLEGLVPRDAVSTRREKTD